MCLRSVVLLLHHLRRILTVGRVTSHHVGTESKRPSVDFGWTWDGFGTGSSGTGPSSGNSGDYYLYLETSRGSTILRPSYAELPVMDLTATPGAQLKYAYHMYGASMGVLKVEVSTDDITWDTLSTKTGQQQAAAIAPCT